MKMKKEILRGKFTAYYYEYLGAGGWSRNAKSRPRPKLVVKHPARIEISGKSAILDGERKLKCTIIRNSTGEIVREDYELSRIVFDALANPLSMAAQDKLVPSRHAPRSFRLHQKYAEAK